MAHFTAGSGFVKNGLFAISQIGHRWWTFFEECVISSRIFWYLRGTPYPTFIVLDPTYYQPTADSMSFTVHLHNCHPAFQRHCRHPRHRTHSLPPQLHHLPTLCAPLALLYTPANEHFGIGSVEGMFSGLPILTCDSGGPTESIIDMGDSSK